VKLVGECNRCGLCCSFLLLPISQEWLSHLENPQEALRWLALHGITLERSFNPAIGPQARIPLACKMLKDDGRCAIYDARMDMCRRWPYGPEDLRHVPDCTLEFVE